LAMTPVYDLINVDGSSKLRHRTARCDFFGRGQTTNALRRPIAWRMGSVAQDSTPVYDIG
jgi:hypothetical protein